MILIMEEIKNKIIELLTLSNLETTDWSWEAGKTKMDKQDKLIDDLRLLAKSNNTILGRTIEFPMADSYALYIITKVNKKTVQLTNVDYCDGHVDDRLGHKGSVSIAYASDFVHGRDRMRELFPVRKTA